MGWYYLLLVAVAVTGQQDTCLQRCTPPAECDASTGQCRVGEGGECTGRISGFVCATGLQCIKQSGKAVCTKCGSQGCFACDPPCGAGEQCIVEAGQAVCKKTLGGCTWMQCPAGQECILSAAMVASCKSVSCSAAVRCGTAGERAVCYDGQAICAPPVTDPCSPCTAKEICRLKAGGAVCEPMSPCASHRAQRGLGECSPPAVCEGEGQCVDHKCASGCPRGTVCGWDGQCVEDKCTAFMWPPPDIKLCSSASDCQTGYSCTGCIPTCYCDPRTGDAVCASDCRGYCKKDQYTCDKATQTRWGKEEAQYCCVVKKVGCSEYACAPPQSSWGKDEMKYCCDVGVAAACQTIGPQVHGECFDLPTTWSTETRATCCKDGVGCLPDVDCKSPSLTPEEKVYCCRSGKGWCACDGTTAPPTEVERKWCCREKGRFCPPKDPYTCLSSSVSEEERRWCCLNRLVLCPVKCHVGDDERASWSEGQRKFCCVMWGVGCRVQPEYNCNADDGWTSWPPDRRSFCCREYNIACEQDCFTAPALLTPTQTDYCCKVKGVCASVTPTVPPDGRVWRTIRLLVLGTWETVQQQRQRFVRKLRLTMLKAVDGLRDDPSRLNISFVGTLVNRERLPVGADERSRFGFPVPPEWNTPENPLPDLITATSTSGDIRPSKLWQSRHAHTLADTTAQVERARDVIFFECTIAHSDTPKLDSIQRVLDTSAEEAVRLEGPFVDNTEDLTLILSPLGKSELIDSSPPPPPQEGNADDDDTPFIVMLLLLVLVAVGVIAVATTVLFKKRGGAAAAGPGALYYTVDEEMKSSHPYKPAKPEDNPPVETGSI